MIRASKLGGVILNRVGSERHRRLVSEAIEQLGVPVLGSLPRSDKVRLPERHLGLVQAGETSGLDGCARGDGGFRRGACRCRGGDAGGRACRRDEARGGNNRRDTRPDRAPAARPAHRARARPGVLLHLSACAAGLARGRRRDRPLLAARRRAAACRLRLLLVARRLSRAARRRGSPRRASFSRACAVSRGRGRCMANAAATWCLVAPSSMLQARATPWPGFCPSSRASRGRRCSSATATRAFSPTPRSAARARD